MNATVMLDDFLAWVLEPDSWRPWRIAAIATAGVMAWRALVLLVQQHPSSARSASEDPQPGLSHRPRLQLFPSRKDRLQRSIDLITTETTLLARRTDNIQATAQLAQARADLQALLDALSETTRTPAGRAAREPSLTLPEIRNLLTLAELEPAQRHTLERLFQAAIEDRVHD